MLYHAGFAADHLAISALESVDSAAGSRVDVMNAHFLERVRSSDIVDVVRVTAVYNNIAALEALCQVSQGALDHRGGHHYPRDPWFGQFLGKVIQRCRAGSALFDQFIDRFLVGVKDHTLMAAAEQSPHHVGAHPAETDHAHLHWKSLLVKLVIYWSAFAKAALSAESPAPRSLPR